MIDHSMAHSISMERYNEERALIRKWLEWFRFAMIEIQADEDVLEGYPAYSLAEMGEHMAGLWLNEMDQFSLQQNRQQ